MSPNTLFALLPSATIYPRSVAFERFCDTDRTFNRFGRHLSACEEQAAHLNGMTQPTRVVFVDYMADQQGPY